MSGAGMGNNLAGLTYYPSNDNDPYITLKNVVRRLDALYPTGRALFGCFFAGRTNLGA